MAQLIYQDDAPQPKVRKPRRKKYGRGKYPRYKNSQSRDVKLLRLPWQQTITVGGAAALMGIDRKSFQVNYLWSPSYLMPDYIEIVRDMGRIVGLKRIGP